MVSIAGGLARQAFFLLLIHSRASASRANEQIYNNAMKEANNLRFLFIYVELIPARPDKSQSGAYGTCRCSALYRICRHQILQRVGTHMVLIIV